MATTTQPATADFLSLGQARKHVPGKPSTATIWRWTTIGFLARNGARIRLRSFRLGRALRIRRDDIAAFAEALAKANAEAFTPSAAWKKKPVAGDSSRQRALEERTSEVYAHDRCTFNILAAHQYIDTIAINCSRCPASRLRKLRTRAGSAFRHRSQDADRRWRLIVHQPTARAVRLLARRFRAGDRVTEVHAACDFSFGTIGEAIAFLRWIRHRLIHRYRRGTHLCRINPGYGLAETIYYAPRGWDTRVLAIYGEDAGRRDTLPTVHVELRFTGRACRRAGYIHPTDAQNPNLLDRLTLADVDLVALGRTFLRAAYPPQSWPRLACARAGRRLAKRLIRSPDDDYRHAQHVADYLRLQRLRPTCLRRIDVPGVAALQ